MDWPLPRGTSTSRYGDFEDQEDQEEGLKTGLVFVVLYFTTLLYPFFRVSLNVVGNVRTERINDTISCMKDRLCIFIFSSSLTFCTHPLKFVLTGIAAATGANAGTPPRYRFPGSDSSSKAPGAVPDAASWPSTDRSPRRPVRVARADSHTPPGIGDGDLRVEEEVFFYCVRTLFSLHWL